MAFGVNVFGPAGQRLASSSSPLLEDDYDSDSASTDSDETARTSSHPLSRSNTSDSPQQDFLHPPNISGTHSGRSSVSSSVTSSPLPSRSSSPLPQFLSHGGSSSDTDTEPTFQHIYSRRGQWAREDRPWWPMRRRRKRDSWCLRPVKRWVRRLVRLPCFPQQPITIVFTLILLSIFGVSLTLLLMYILNPDKEPLPWRAYCSIPSMGSPPDHSTGTYNSSTDIPYPPFPPDNFDALPPAGIFLGVFSTDSSFERRSLIRSTWASHPRSRDGAGDGDGGASTSRTIVRFILGQPRKDWERRVKLEMDTYNDMVILPITENMNKGKTHTFFSWASIHAWVPPVYEQLLSSSSFSYSNHSSAAPRLAPHDPIFSWDDQASGRAKPWVRPDFVVKMDDDAFTMLAELEARLRVQLYSPSESQRNATSKATSVQTHTSSSTNNATSDLSVLRRSPSGIFTSYPTAEGTGGSDAMIYWGYLVTNRFHRFMAGELYALSWNLVEWVAKEPMVKGLTWGAEDKQVAQWMKAHPQAKDIRWASQRCWIYDHPRAGTVYAHGFLFPSEVTRVRRDLHYPPSQDVQHVHMAGGALPTPSAWAHSSVSTFRVRYAAPVADLSTKESVEALVEGSDMSMLHEGNPMTPEYAWSHREGRRRRYEGKRVGGTVVVHFVKKHMWYLETALALLDGEEVSETEMFEQGSAAGERSVGYSQAGLTFSGHSSSRTARPFLHSQRQARSAGERDEEAQS